MSHIQNVSLEKEIFNVEQLNDAIKDVGRKYGKIIEGADVKSLTEKIFQKYEPEFKLIHAKDRSCTPCGTILFKDINAMQVQLQTHETKIDLSFHAYIGSKSISRNRVVKIVIDSDEKTMESVDIILREFIDLWKVISKYYNKTKELDNESIEKYRDVASKILNKKIEELTKHDTYYGNNVIGIQYNKYEIVKGHGVPNITISARQVTPQEALKIGNFINKLIKERKKDKKSGDPEICSVDID